MRSGVEGYGVGMMGRESSVSFNTRLSSPVVTLRLQGRVIRRVDGQTVDAPGIYNTFSVTVPRPRSRLVCDYFEGDQTIDVHSHFRQGPNEWCCTRIVTDKGLDTPFRKTWSKLTTLR